jgi:heptose I phosphotransferase
VADFFLRADVREIVPGGWSDTDALLRWAADTADGAAPEAIYRDREGRRTVRLELGGRGYFLKFHRGVGWREIFKNLVLGRLPIVGAGSEYRAIRALHKAGVETLSVAAYASRGINPARRQSMILTDELVGTASLEDFCEDWSRRAPPFALRLRLIKTLALMSRRMHEAGINHRDFYLCHFHLATDELSRSPLRCYLIDLHRAQCRASTPVRWRVKDLAGLWFSAMDCGLGQRDLQRFARHYHPGGLRQAVNENLSMWRRAHRLAVALYRKAHRITPPAPADKVPEGCHGP